MVGETSGFGENLEPPDDYDPFGISKPIPRSEPTGPIEPLLEFDDSTTPADPGPRLPYWDRPKQPRDWYWFLGRLGSSLIVLGLLMFLFVGYQLWGTGIEEAQSQNRLEDTFSQLMTPVDTSTPTVTTTTVAATEPSVTTTTPPTPREPIEITEGDPIALIEMPSIGVKKFVVAGVQTPDLKKGPGHYPNTPFPGELGNAAIAGHRTTYGEPFRKLDDLAIGDEIRVTDLFGRQFVYRVTGSRIVDPSDSWVVATTDLTRAILTLTTCHPEFSAKQRLIVSAELDISVSPPTDEPAAKYVNGTEGTSNDESVIDTLPTTTTTIVESSATTIATETTTTTTTTTIATPIDQRDFEVDTFAEGWFSDPSAWPQVIVWGLLEILIVWGAWQVAKRFRNRLIGAAVGFVPFFVVLYFVFQNVNRLLPPNL